VLDAVGVTAPELAVCCLGAAAGGVVQAVIGFGYALVVVPVLLLVAPETVPVAPLTVALPMVLWLAWADRAALDGAGFGRLTLGRLPGTVVGAWLLTRLDTSLIAGAAGALLLLAVFASGVRGARRTSPRLEVAAGFVSGIAGTVGAVGGPYLGLAYADRPGAVLRATVSAAFAVGVVLSLAAIVVAGAVASAAVWLGVALVPATVVGLGGGRRVAERLRGPMLRRVVLSFAGGAGAFALVRALV